MFSSSDAADTVAVADSGALKMSTSRSLVFVVASDAEEAAAAVAAEERRT